MLYGVELRIQLTTAWYLRSKSTVAVLLMTWPGSNACTRPRGEQAIPSSQTSSQLGTVAVSRSPATSTWTPLMKSDPRQSVAKIIPTRCCTGGVEHNLEQSHWFEAVAQSCYQGSSLHGAIRIESVSRNRTVSLEVPPPLRNNCWIAVIAKDDSPSAAVIFELVDVDGARVPFGSVTDDRNVLPASGPFCSVGGRIRQLVATTNSEVSVMFHLAWYSVVPVEAPIER